MNFGDQAPQFNVKERIENERRASFKGYDVQLKRISPRMEEISPENRGAYFPALMREISVWAKAYRGYIDEDSFYELIVDIQDKFANFIDQEDCLISREYFINGMYEIIDETFPQKLQLFQHPPTPPTK